MNYSMAIFDLDGTLIDTSEGIYLALRYTADFFGINLSGFSDLSCFIGPPIQHSIQRYWNVSKQVADEMAAVFRSQYKDAFLLKAEPYTNIYATLETMRRNGLALAVATYKRQDYMEQLLAHFHFDKYLTASYGSDMEGKLSKADIIKLCYNSISIPPSKVVMIGDTAGDAIGSELLGIDFVGVTYGFGFHHQQEVLQHKCAVAAASTPEEIIELLGLE